MPAAAKPAAVPFSTAPALANLRIHTDHRAAAAAEGLGAEAFTRGREIFFGSGRYRPETAAGRSLFFHELAHVTQQRIPGAPASREALEQEADQAAVDMSLGRAPHIRLAAPAHRPLLQGAPPLQGATWVTGDVFADAAAAAQIKTQGGLFSGNDQAHINVSNQGKLAYDSGYTSPEDPFRWSRLKEIVDSGHLKIAAVSDQTPFPVVEAPGKPPVNRSIADIRLLVGDLTVMGIALHVGEQSPDPVYDLIFYDQAQGVGALSHELFGHTWLALKGAPSVHPPAGSQAEKTKGTILPSHKIEDPFGNIFSGTVRSYISKYVESLGSSVAVKTSTGQQINVPKSPTQQVGKQAVIQAFTDLTNQAASGLTKNTYSAPVAQAWRSLCNNYDLMQTNAEAIRNGNSDLTYTREVILFICYTLFQSWGKDQQSGFRILLADYTMSRSGFTPNELSSKLEALVGMAPSPFKPAVPATP
jgi:hypothetical protein